MSKAVFDSGCSNFPRSNDSTLTFGHNQAAFRHRQEGLRNLIPAFFLTKRGEVLLLPPQDYDKILGFYSEIQYDFNSDKREQWHTALPDTDVQALPSWV